MKRKIAMILIGLMCVSGVGCSNPFGSKSAIDISDAAKADIFANIGDYTVVENSEAAEVFTNSMAAVSSAENLTITVENNIVMGTEGDVSYQESESYSEIKLNKTDESQTGNVEIENVYRYVPDADGDELTEEKSDITGYYEDDRLYFITNDGDKVQEEMSFDDFLAVVNNYELSIFEECISQAAYVEDSDGKTYYISYDPLTFENTMNTNMEASGQYLDDGESMSVNYANIVAKVDSEENLLAYAFVIDAEYIYDLDRIPYSYTLQVDFSDRGTTKTKAVKDMDSYMTVDEYTEMMEERYSSYDTDSSDDTDIDYSLDDADDTDSYEDIYDETDDSESSVSGDDEETAN